MQMDQQYPLNSKYPGIFQTLSNPGLESAECTGSHTELSF